jgi:DNA-3-methyladenine glycosylase
MTTPLPIEFYNRSTLTVARELLGARLVRILDGVRLSGKIVETEAYVGESDLGCHARAGKTPRTGIMYGRAGLAYIYFTYGMHWCLNAITEAEGFPAAVLIRAIIPLEGTTIIAARRNGHSTDGPAKLTQALGIDGAQNGIDLTTAAANLWIEPGEPIPADCVTQTPRVGLYSVPEPWKSIRWRFLANSGKNS